MWSMVSRSRSCTVGSSASSRDGSRVMPTPDGEMSQGIGRRRAHSMSGEYGLRVVLSFWELLTAGPWTDRSAAARGNKPVEG